MVEVERRAQSIFLQALEKRADERVAFLDEVCKGEVELRAKVDRLLSSRLQLGEIKEPHLDKSNESIANYQLTERIGEGGFGEVFAADQAAPIRRQVALKILKRGMDSDRVIARFDTERQVLAIMDHPNVAKIYDAGVTESGRPYFAMELVNGSSITEFCDSHKFSIRRRIELFLDVCSAIQHAHQKGIIHRDLKPKNILVSFQHGTPVVKVIDFGIAKAIAAHTDGQSQHTAKHELLGTPSYMSPEQTLGHSDEVDTRSDVYSLGVVLHELLTGSIPFDSNRFLAAELVEGQRVIRELEPSKPSSKVSSGHHVQEVAAQRSTNPVGLVSQISGEIDWIILKTLEKDRNRRYQTVNAFAQDLQKYLDDEPVTACPPSLIYQLSKYSKRHRKAILVTAAAMVVMLLLVAFATWNYVDRIRTREQAARTALELKAAKSEARSKSYLDALAQLSSADQVLAGLMRDKKQRVVNEHIGKAIRIRDTIDAPDFRAQIDYGIRSVWLKAQASYDFIPTLRMQNERLTRYRPNAYSVHPAGEFVVMAGKTCPCIIHRHLGSNDIPISEKVSKSAVWHSPSGKWVAHVSDEGQVSLWDERALECVGRWMPDEVSQVLDIAFTKEERSLTLIDEFGIVRQFEVPTLKATDPPAFALRKTPDKLVAGALSRDARRLAVVDVDGYLTVCDAQSELARIVIPNHTPCTLTWSRDASFVAVNTVDRTIVLPLDRVSVPREFLHAFTAAPDRAVITGDGRILISSSMVWDLDAGLATLSTSHWPVGVAADGATIVCVEESAVVFGTLIHPTIAHACYGHQGSVVRCTWSANSKRFASIDNSFVVCVWEAAQGRLLYRVQLPPGNFYPDNGGLALNDEGTIACYMYRRSDLSGCAYIMDVDHGRLSTPVQLPVSGFFQAVFRPSQNDFLGVCEHLEDENRVATTTLSISSTGNVETGHVLRRSPVGERRFLDHKLSNDGRYYAWLGPRLPIDPRRLEILETTANAQNPILMKSLPRQPPDHPEPAMRFTPDFSTCWLAFSPWRAEQISVFDNRTTPIDFRLFPVATNGNKWTVHFPAASEFSMQRPVTLNLLKFGEQTPWVGFHRDGASGEFHNGSAYFSPDGNWVTWGKDVSGQLTVVDLKALEEGVNQLSK